MSSDAHHDTDSLLEEGLKQIVALQLTAEHSEVVRLSNFYLDAFSNSAHGPDSPKGVVLRQLCDVHYYRGLAYFHLVQYEHALEDITTSLELGSSRVLPRTEYIRRVMLRGEVNTLVGRTVTAIRDFKAALATCKDDEEDIMKMCWYNLGVVCRTLPHLAAAVRWFSKAADTEVNFQDNFVLSCLLLNIKTHEELKAVVECIPEGSDEVVVSVVRSAVIDYVMRTSMIWIEENKRPVHSHDNPEEAQSHYTTREPGETLPDTIPVICNEVLCVFTNGKMRCMDDLCGIPSDVKGMMRTALMVLLDFSMSFCVSEVLKVQESEEVARLSGCEAVDIVPSLATGNWDLANIPDMIALVHSNALLRMPAEGARNASFFRSRNRSFIMTPKSDNDALEPGLEQPRPAGLGLDVEFAQSYDAPIELPSIEAGSPSMLLEPVELSILHNELPFRYRDMSWSCVYSTRLHGTSYRTLVQRCKGVRPTLFLIQDSHNRKIGAFLNVDVELMLTYGGNGETFVFTTCPSAVPAGSAHLHAYRWSRRNKHFVHFTSDYFMFGGGGHCAVRVEEDLLKGQTYECSTFDSPPLLDSEQIEILSVEVWTFK
eukprot:PhM_4_TR12685/c0_g1_i1/m.17170